MPAFKKAKKSSGGEPIITHSLIKELVDSIYIGNSCENAAAGIGIDRKTLTRWLKKGRSGKGKIKQDSIYGDLSLAVSKANRQCATRKLIRIENAAEGQEWEYERYPEGSIDLNGDSNEGRLILNSRGNPIVKKIGIPPDWRADAWWLERRFPEEWGISQKLIHTGKDGGPIQSEDLTETPEQAEARRKRVDEKIQRLKVLKDDGG